jgi:hypothetical protein
MSELDQIQKEAIIENIYKKIFGICKNHKKKIITFLFFAIIAIIFYISHFFYIKNVNTKHSSMLQELSLDKEYPEEKLQILISQNSSKPIKFIASMQYAKILFANDKIDQAIELYLKINDDNDNDKFFREYAGLIAIKHIVHLNDNKKYQILDIINKMESESLYLKDYILEQKAIYYWKNDLDIEAKEIFNNLVTNIESSENIKKRAKMIIEVGFDKFEER